MTRNFSHVLRVLFFGSLRDAAGGAELSVAPPPDIATIAALRSWLAGRDAKLGEALTAPGVRMARDQHFCGDDAPLAGATEIAFMSPLSGG